MKWIKSLGLSLGLFAQTISAQNATEIYQQLQQLNTLASVLYIAAHPDDENTRLITHFAQHEHARTAYLSLTRGDGGQNLIGPELREGLGLIRTHELLQARKIDGGKQFFSSANDFGYSKNPEETLQIWDKEQVLKEMVYLIQSFRPDIIINRFDHRTPGRTHGHHTASAQLSLEAFHRAAQGNGSLGGEAWKTQRLYFNTSWWFYGSREKFEAAPKDRLLPIEVGQYNPSTGAFHGAIAARSRSQHKSQGFGSRPLFNTQTEYLELIKGDLSAHPLAGIDTRWTRVKGGANIGRQIDSLLENFDFKTPSNHLSELINIRKSIATLEDEHWKSIKLLEIDQIIQKCLGLKLYLNSPVATGVPQQSLEVSLQAHSPTPNDILLKEISFGEQTYPIQKTLKPEGFEERFSIDLPNRTNAPYWLIQKGSLGMYRPAPSPWIGKAETPNAVEATLTLSIENTPVSYPIPLMHRYTDPVKGWVSDIFHILPEATAAPTQAVYLFANERSKTLSIDVQIHSQDFQGTLELCYPEDWKVSPPTYELSGFRPGENRPFEFEVTPPKGSAVGYVSPLIRSGQKVFDKSLTPIQYDHIPKRLMLQPSEAKVVRLEIESPVERIGYIEGAGDQVAENLQAIGIEVQSLDATQFSLADLEKFKAVVLGIRAFNVHPTLSFKNEILWDYVEQGGTVVVQYNTTRGLKTKAVAPYPIQLSRKRVTDEKAPVRILDPNAPLLNTPNRIRPKDFEGWVQERGLYFPETWDSAFKPLIAINDPGETPLKGSLLVAPYGNGKIVYTGLSFFRQLPAGVPGAYRLFLNLLAHE